jgi:hypothetical protein
MDHDSAALFQTATPVDGTADKAARVQDVEFYRATGDTFFLVENTLFKVHSLLHF